MGGRVVLMFGGGMGLGTTHGIVAWHSGKILVERHQGSGSLFTIFLPLAGITGIGVNHIRQNIQAIFVFNLNAFLVACLQYLIN